MDERIYYIAKGRSLEIVEDWHTAEAALHEHATAMVKELGADGCYFHGGGGQLYGFSFKDGPPEGFKREKGYQDIYTPKGRNKAANELRRRMLSITSPSASAMTCKLTGQVTIFGGPAPGGGMRVLYVTIEKIGDDWIIGVPIPGGDKELPDPPDAERIKTSEYYRLQEELEEAG